MKMLNAIAFQYTNLEISISLKIPIFRISRSRDGKPLSGVEKWAQTVIQVLSDRDLEFKSGCKGVQGLKGLRSGIEKWV